jgi:hypothetical protein
VALHSYCRGNVQSNGASEVCARYAKEFRITWLCSKPEKRKDCKQQRVTAVRIYPWNAAYRKEDIKGNRLECSPNRNTACKVTIQGHKYEPGMMNQFSGLLSSWTLSIVWYSVL